MVMPTPEQWADSDTTSFMPGPMGFGMGFGMQMKHAYYTIYFPNTYDGQTLLSPEQQSIRLVFLDEIDGDERGEGTWEITH